MAARAMINVYLGYGFFLMVLLGLVHAGAPAERQQMLATDTIRPRPGVRTVDTVRYWPFGRMPYAFTDDFPEDGKLFIRAALQYLMNKTNVRIIERTTEKDYALVTKNGEGCSAVIGRQGGAQLLTLAAGCYSDKMTVLHEFLHAYGMNHEHVRPDRDRYVEVNYTNVAPVWRQWYQIENDEAIRSTLGLAYDFRSIMHYSLGRSGEWNSTTWQMRPRAEYQASLMDFDILTDLSALDIERANLLYESYVQRSKSEDDVTVQASLIYYILSGASSARRRSGCSTLVRPPNHKCRIFFMVHHKSFPDLRHGLTDAPVSYGPYDDVTFQFLNGQQTQHNITTAPGSRVELSVTSYFAYYKGNVPVYNQHVRFQGTEGIATHMFVYDTGANQTNPVVMEDDRAAFRTWTKLYVGFELFK